MRAATLLVALATASCVSHASEESALRRGDLAFAQGDLDEAIAEYQLAVRQGSDDPETLARVAHTYAQLGRVDDAGSYYRRVVEADEDMADQAVSDLIWLARERQAQGDDFAMAMAVESALQLRPGLGIGELALPMARHYFRNGEHGRALPFYQKAIAETADSGPEIVFEVGQAYYEIGDCRHALVFFERFHGLVRRWERGEVDWYIGTCSFSLARELSDGLDAVTQARRVDEERDRLDDPRRNRRDEDRRARPGPEPRDTPLPAEYVERLREALRHIDRAVEVGEPRNIQSQAWFEKGEILSAMGECDAAMDAYARVRAVDPGSSWADRAQAAYDEIRFGQSVEQLRGGPCR